VAGDVRYVPILLQQLKIERAKKSLAKVDPWASLRLRRSLASWR
jgi:hypothetical protein